MIDRKYSESFENMIEAAGAGELAIVETTTESGELAILISIVFQDPSGDYTMIPIAKMLDPKDPTAGYIDPSGAAESERGKA